MSRTSAEVMLRSCLVCTCHSFDLLVLVLVLVGRNPTSFDTTLLTPSGFEELASLSMILLIV
jgi:hypothetical protein